MILVAGGTGRLGTALVGRFTARGEQVRVLTRDPRRASHLPPVEVAAGDVRRPDDLRPAMTGVDAVVSAVHGFAGRGVSPASVNGDGNACLIEAAASVGAHVVLLSVLSASPTHPIELFRTKAAAEDLLRRSRLPWTIVRAGASLELHRYIMRRTSGRSGRPLVFRRGESPVAFASVGEVAAVADRASDPSCRWQVIEVARTNLTFNQRALEGGRVATSPRLKARTVRSVRNG